MTFCEEICAKILWISVKIVVFSERFNGGNVHRKHAHDSSWHAMSHEIINGYEKIGKICGKTLVFSTLPLRRKKRVA